MSLSAVDPVEQIRLVPEEQARADIYRLLGNLLAAPPDMDGLIMLQSLDGGDGPWAGLWTALRDAARSTDVSGLEEEFNRLFIGLGRGELVPYASFYLAGFLMEKPLAELRGELGRFGLQRQVEVAEPEDHAAALCEVMGLLIEENRLNFTNSRVFYQAYIGSWLGRFFQDLGQADGAHFYRAVADLGRHFMEIEQAYYDMPE